ncbi:MAG: DUF2239 family protein, partial [Casimicrobium sp.]
MNKSSNQPRYVAFQRGKRVAEGSESEISAKLAALSISPYAYGAYDAGFDPTAQAMVFDLRTGERIELMPDPAPATPEPDVPAPPPSGPGRPKLGVISREVTLLPHDWEWLNQQPGGASVTLRKLVLTARRMSQGADRARQAKIVCYRFVTAIAGHEAGYEEATRALFTGKSERFAAHTETWPADVRDHARLLANAAFTAHAAA